MKEKKYPVRSVVKTIEAARAEYNRLTDEYIERLLMDAGIDAEEIAKIKADLK